MSVEYLVRFVVSPRQYELVHEKLSIRLVSGMPTPRDVYKSEIDSRAAQQLVRQNLRLFLKVWGAGALFNVLLKMRGENTRIPSASIASSVALVAASYRFISQLVQSPNYARLRPLAPILCGLAAAPAFNLLPSSIKPFLALYTASKAAEYLYNYLDDKGYLEWKPRWLGSWILYPVAMSQLFYTFIVQPEHCPRSFRLFMTYLSGGYLPEKPAGFPASQHWPSENEVLAGVAEISRLKFPAFKSPLIYRNQVWSETLKPIFSVLEYAHPGNPTMTGALLHPVEKSEFKVFSDTVGANYRSTTKYILPLYLAISLIKNRCLTGPGVLGSISNTLRSSTTLAMSAASAWAGIGLSQKMLGTRTLAGTRFRVIGFMSGLWAFIDQVNGRARNQYMLRLAILSQYNIFIARRKGKPLVKGGSSLLFGASLALISALYNQYPPSISSPTARTTLNWMECGDNGDPSPLPESDSA